MQPKEVKAFRQRLVRCGCTEIHIIGTTSGIVGRFFVCYRLSNGDYIRKTMSKNEMLGTYSV